MNVAQSTLPRTQALLFRSKQRLHSCESHPLRELAADETPPVPRH